MAICGVKRRPRLRHLAAAFAIGALVSESIGFAHYFVSYGYHDRELALGVIGSVMEFVAIAVIGGLATCARRSSRAI